MTRTLFHCVAAAAVFSSCLGWDVYADYDEYPPSAYIATATPVYYNGVPAYYYGNRWYYRDGARWRYYRDEPVYLHDYRVRPAVVQSDYVVRQNYGRGQYYGHSPEYHGAVRVGGGSSSPPQQPHGSAPVRSNQGSQPHGSSPVYSPPHR